MESNRRDFPFFRAHPGLAYLDTATTSHKPESVIRTLCDFYAHDYASAFRGSYALAEQATQRYEDTRALCASFIGAQPHEIVFTKGATESINLVAHAWAATHLKPGDELVISEIEHHANILPWQKLAQSRKATLRWLAYDPETLIAFDQLSTVITPQTKLVALTATSNVLGSFLGGYRSALAPVIERAHAVGARVLIDAAQLAGHERIDVGDLGCDFLTFSGHKMLGPQGVGVLYVKQELHSQLIPYQLGGGMVTDVTYDTAHYRAFPCLFEAGTQAAAQVIGFGAALAYLKERVDFEQLKKHEAALYQHLRQELEKIERVQVLGPAGKQRDHILSFTCQGIHPHDVAAYLDSKGICVRAGNQCAQVLHKRLGIGASVRASFYVYTSHEDIERLVKALIQLCTLW